MKISKNSLVPLIVLAFLAASATTLAATDDSQLIRKAKQNVTSEFKDPDSAKFRNIRVIRGSVCGEVNAKNSYGGYVGYRRFVSVGGIVAWLEGETTDFSEHHDRMCSKNPPKPKAPPAYYEESWKDLERDLSAPKIDAEKR